MTQTLSARIPAGWDRGAAQLWLQSRRVEAVNRATAAAQAAQWRQPALALQTAYYLFLMEDFRSGAALLERQAQSTPGEFEILLNLGVMCSRAGLLERACEVYGRAAEIDANRFEIHDGLANAMSRLHRYDEATTAGTRSLELKDALAPHKKPLALPQGSPAQWTKGKANVLSYSLWGSHPRYLRGMLRNVVLGPDLYPGWEIRIHLDDTVPADFCRLVEELGARIERHLPGAPLREKLAWRFGVANDVSVGRFLVRDADSVINVREVFAVHEWIRSGCWFHVMRDYWTHTDLMLAGMWGGVAGALPSMDSALAAYRPAALETPNVDQWFLRDCVWPCIRESVEVHDRCFRPARAKPFPGSLPPGNEHVGQDEFEARPAAQQRLLRPWRTACPSLQLE